MRSTECSRTIWRGPRANRKVSPTDRIDVALVTRGLARSRVRAVELIRSGLVQVDGVRITKSSQIVAANAIIEVLTVSDQPDYVSRAAVKLAGALDAFNEAHRLSDGRLPSPRVEGASCLDIGASTGGFTDVLLRRGARHVLAIDVGHDQFDPLLRADHRVTVREGINVRDLTAPDIPGDVSLVVGDLSFISLRLVLPALVNSVTAAEMLLMVKPQFEVGRDRLGKGGVVRDAQLHIDAVRGVCQSAQELGLRTRAIVASSLPGPSGNREFFCWFTGPGTQPDAGALSSAISHAVTDTTEGRRVFFVSHDPAVGQNGPTNAGTRPQGGTR